MAKENGIGKSFNSKGEYFEGNFINGKPCGYGRYVY